MPRCTIRVRSVSPGRRFECHADLKIAQGGSTVEISKPCPDHYAVRWQTYLAQFWLSAAVSFTTRVPTLHGRE